VASQHLLPTRSSLNQHAANRLTASSCPGAARMPSAKSAESTAAGYQWRRIPVRSDVFSWEITPLHESSVFVVVTLVDGVTTAVVDVVDVVTMRDRDMAATLAVHVIMPRVGNVLAGLALVVVAVVSLVQVSVVDVVDVVAVRDGDMPTSLAVGVFVSGVLGVRSSHFGPSTRSRWEIRSAPNSCHINRCAYVWESPREGRTDKPGPASVAAQPICAAPSNWACNPRSLPTDVCSAIKPWFAGCWGSAAKMANRRVNPAGRVMPAT